MNDLGYTAIYKTNFDKRETIKKYINNYFKKGVIIFS